ncbi:MAG TPA: SGNH/GDSL hydrolase family protein [Tepidisphaeraceae bacterium]|nr:SGNH/GDSL hydrolase family protein [Tepidisphaeraceae bacterium]
MCVRRAVLLFSIAFLLFAPVCRAQDQRIVREPIEWLDVWLPNSDASDLPRVLLIGDSITRAYYPKVADLLKGKAYVGRLATSKCVGDPLLVEQVKLVLSESHFDVIHFNNGMHGWGYTEIEYRDHFPDFFAAIQAGAPDAKLIWASTTPVREANHVDQFSDRTDRVRQRNEIAADVLTAHEIGFDDLFSLVLNHPEYYKPDGVHFDDAGVEAEAEQVADKILQVLPSH